MKRLLFVYSEQCVKMLEKKFFRDLTIVSLTPESDYFMVETGCGFKHVKDYGFKPIPHHEIYSERIKLNKTWGKIKINDKSLEEQLTVNGISLWDILETEIGELHLEMIMQYTGIIKHILQCECPDEIIFKATTNFYLIPRDKTFFPELIQSISNSLKIDCEIIKPGQVLNSIKQKTFELGLRGGMWFRGTQRRHIQKYCTLGSKRGVLTFLYGSGMDKTYPVEKQLLHKNVDVINICGGGVRTNNCADFFKTKQSMYAYNESFLDVESIHDIEYWKNKITKLLPLITDQAAKFVYKEVCLFNVIKHQIEYIFKIQLGQLLMTIFTTSKIMKGLNPDMVVVVNDTVFHGRCAVLTAKKYNVPTLLIQHAQTPDRSSLTFPVSDHVAVWEPFDNMDKRFFVAGSTKQLSLRKTIKQYDHTELLTKIGRGRKIILLATRYPATRDLFIIKTLYKFVKDNPSLIGLVKIHPADTTISESKLERIFPSSNVLFLKRNSFIELLAIAHVVISTTECTTHLDAIMVEKPLITIDYDKYYNPAWTDERDYGLAPPFLRSYSERQLIQNIKDVLFTPTKKKEIITKMKQYNNNHFKYTNSDNRIAKFIINTIKSKDLNTN